MEHFRRSCYPKNYKVTNTVTDFEVLRFGLDIVKVPSLHLPGGSEKNYENLSQGSSFYRKKFETDFSNI
jgi:hypothetical protein